MGDGAPRRPLLEEQLKDSGPRACRTQACPLIGFQPRLHGFQVQGVRGGVRDYPGRDFTGLRDRVGLSRRVSAPSGEKSSLYHEQGSRCSSSPGGRGWPAGGAETPSGGWHAGAEDQSPEKGLRPAGRPGPCSFTTLCASCTESLWETWPFPLARLWLVRNPAFTCQSGPRGAPVRALEPVLGRDCKEHVATQDREDAGHCGTCTCFRETSRQLLCGSFRERKGYCPETGLDVEAEVSLSAHLLALPRLPGRAPGKLATHN